MTEDEAIEHAKRLLEEHHDPSLAVFLLRDLPIIKEAGLSDLAWELAWGKTGCSKNDVKGLLENLEDYKWKKSQSQSPGQ